MPIDRRDAAYGYVVAANEKEARNRLTRKRKKARADNTHPALFMSMAVLSLGVAWMNLDQGNLWLAGIWVLIAGAHTHLARNQLRKRRSAVGGLQDADTVGHGGLDHDR